MDTNQLGPHESPTGRASASSGPSKIELSRVTSAITTVIILSEEPIAGNPHDVVLWWRQTLELILSTGLTKMVLDADGLRLLQDEKRKRGAAGGLPPDWILTPHAGELEGLLKGRGFTEPSVTAQDIESDRYYWCQTAAKFLGCWVVLKGFRTMVSDGKSTFFHFNREPLSCKIWNRRRFNGNHCRPSSPGTGTWSRRPVSCNPPRLDGGCVGS